jgi:hypothetical protein
MFAAVVLTALLPIVAHDAGETSPLTSAAGGPPAAYARTVPMPGGGAWVQYWLYYAYQDQDRGLLRSGRHEGDWELVQFRVTASGRPVEAVYAQHSGAERCAFSEITTRAGRPVVFAAHGSHASYARASARDRLWPDPNDEADGRGVLVRPRLVEITATSPPFMRRSTPWGDSRASRFVPFEQSSPPGPAFQPDRWDDPAAFAASARPCQAGCDEIGECDGPEKALTAAAIIAPLAAIALWWRRPNRRVRRA